MQKGRRGGGAGMERRREKEEEEEEEWCSQMAVPPCGVSITVEYSMHYLRPSIDTVRIGLVVPIITY